MKTIPFPTPAATATSTEAWAYLRVSTDRQENSLAAQRAEHESYCASHGLHLAGVTTDEDTSGSMPFFERPNVQAMLSGMPGDCRRILISKLDRGFRSAVDGLRCMEELLELGFRATIYDLGADTSTPDGKLMLTIKLGVAEFENGMRRQRQRDAFQVMRDGRRRTGAVPYGWDAVPAARTSKTGRAAEDLVVNVREQRILRLILTWHKQGVTDHVISRNLRGMGVPTKTGRPKWYAITVRSVREHALLEAAPALAA